LFAIVAVPFDAYQQLPSSQHRWLLACLARYADREGKCWPSMRQLAADAKMSLATVCRYLAAMAALGVFQRERKPGGRYCYRLAAAYVPRWPGRVSAAQRGVSGAETQEAKPAKQIFKRRFAEDLPVEPWEQRVDAWRTTKQPARDLTRDGVFSWDAGCGDQACRENRN
jgi:DNA-binding transcriptional MocR family regulator